ncbi:MULTISPECIES: hypothetical protein [unclassified Nitrobacter]|uniref:hypothetical protein n=1 Tax=unclassified Nitrobacter TaxID=2620411 RepID=UPI0003250FB0|nr:MULTISPECIES: hypothetical protein [unclassified Nitrobacter]MCV0385215.1 hypothetical protein [Nitrobacter sp.]
MADDKHDDVSQEGNSRPLSTGDDATGISGAAENAAPADGGEAAGDQQAGNWPSTSSDAPFSASSGADDASQDRGWQDQSSATDLGADLSVAADETDPGSGGAVDDQPLARQPAPPRSPSRASLVLIAAFSGAVAAGIVAGGAWLAGLPPSPTVPSSEPQVSQAEFGALANRVDRIEAAAGKPAASSLDQAAAERIETLDKSAASLREELTSLREELATVRGQSDRLAAALKDGTAVPRQDGETPSDVVPSDPAPSDLAALSARLAQTQQQVEQMTQTLTAEETAKRGAAPADDGPLRLAVAATLLNVAVRQGQPYGDLLAVFRTLISEPDKLKPLEAFAESGVPSANVLSRELLAIVPKLEPAPIKVSANDIVNRLQESAVRLVRIERLDAPPAGDSAGAVVARIKVAARHNDVAAARKELNTLPPTDRTTAEPWIAKVDARDAALATARQFASEAMAALAKPAP